jgi:uncharacterized RDD family membrane protein YckC
VSNESSNINWPGKRIGLPFSGPGSLAKMGRRVAAISIDWAVALFLAATFFKYDNTAILVVFFSMNYLFEVTAQGTIGHRLLGMRLIRNDGTWVGFWRPLLRNLLLLLVIPVAIWDADGRGLHDKASGTILVRS